MGFLTRNVCRCDHLRSVHMGPAAACGERLPLGRDEDGDLFHMRCPCPGFQQTSLSWWRFFWCGAEEAPGRGA